ncbi:hypothetical protein GCM10009801_73430 [Streptomyces albiaxialis]|uniref:DUF1579 domain-containing protein n=1 Tax=Streptomyces albiaxialis TaxID=329523 RepID=A0ABN2WWV2_9ACTN
MTRRATDTQRDRVPWRTLGATALTLALSGFLIAASPVGAEDGEGSAPKQAAKDARKSTQKKEAPRPAPPQMKALDPLLGNWKCVQTDPKPPEGSEGTVSYMTTHRSLNGHYLYSDVILNPGNLRGRQVFGWNPVKHEYIRYSYDDWGTSESGTSPGPKDGRLVFRGSGTEVMVPSETGKAEGIHMKELVDEYTFVRPGLRKVHTSVTTPDGKTVEYGGYCERTKKKPAM